MNAPYSLHRLYRAIDNPQFLGESSIGTSAMRHIPAGTLFAVWPDQDKPSDRASYRVSMLIPLEGDQHRRMDTSFPGLASQMLAHSIDAQLHLLTTGTEIVFAAAPTWRAPSWLDAYVSRLLTHRLVGPVILTSELHEALQ
ncbi:MAG: hypothetical protein R3E87_15105 [Burkholderiaceae bacterium]